MSRGTWVSAPRRTPSSSPRSPRRGPAVAVSRGLDRDRVVDETGNQTVVFGRRGSRPFNAAEFNMFLRRAGQLFRVEDVAANDGVLRTASGRALVPSARFTPEPTPAQEPGRPEELPEARRPVAERALAFRNPARLRSRSSGFRETTSPLGRGRAPRQAFPA